MWPWHIQAPYIQCTESHDPFALLSLYQRIIPGLRHFYPSHNKACFYDELLAPHPTPQAGGPPIVGCLWLLIQYVCSYTPYWRPFLHPQPEDAPCCGNIQQHTHYFCISVNKTEMVSNIVGSKANGISAYCCALTPLELGSLLRGGDIFGVIYWWISLDAVCLFSWLVKTAEQQAVLLSLKWALLSAQVMLCSVKDADMEKYVTYDDFKNWVHKWGYPCVGFCKIIH